VIHRLFAALIVLALALAAGGGGAREWKPTAQSLAENYAQIVDRRSPHEVVFVMWLVPELLPDGPESALARQILDDYLVIAVIHADVSELGEFSFRKVEDLTVNTVPNGTLRPLVADAVPPAVAGTLSTLRGVFGQTLGPMGRGAQWFAFNGDQVSSCKAGAFSVPYDGVDYSYQTPIPGCP